MSSGFGLPILDLQRTIAGLGTAYSDAYDRERQRGALERLGGQLQSGDYAGGAQTAFAAGDAGTGLSILKLGETRRQTLLGERAADDFAKGLGGLFGGAGGSGPTAPRADASPASRALPSFADASGPAGDYIGKLFQRESGNNPLARASTSSATGLGQFTDRTWAGVMRDHPDLGLTADGRTDPEQMTRATRAFTADNEGLLQRAGLPVNDATRYSMHFLGAGGGRRFVAGTLSNPDAPATSYASPEQVAANRSVFFDRDGAPKTAGQVMSDFARSFGGGAVAARRPVGPGVEVAETEAQARALERRMGMVPAAPTAPLVASADPEADIPAVGAREAMLPRASDRVLPSTDNEARNVPPPSAPPTPAPPSVPVPTLGAPGFGGASSSGRTMTMPGEEPVRVAQARTGAPVADDAATIGSLPVQRIEQSPLGQRIPILTRALANPYLPDGQRQLAQTFLKEALEQTRMPEGVKEYLWARANGMTQARTPGEYEREKKGPQTIGAGSSVLAPDGRSILLTAPERNRSNVADDVEARRAAAAEIGLQPGSPAFQSYVLTGKMPREDAQPYTATDKKNILDADEKVAANEGVIGNLREAKELSAKAYAGPFSSERGRAMALIGNEAGQATLELDNLVTTNALGQLKSIFGAAPTEGERKILLDIQGSSSLPHAVRVKIYDRAIALAERRLEINRERATELRGQTYYRPGGGGAASGASSSGSSSSGPSSPGPASRALPAPSPSNRPGAASAGERFEALTRSGLSREQAYERMQGEGY